MVSLAPSFQSYLVWQGNVCISLGSLIEGKTDGTFFREFGSDQGKEVPKIQFLSENDLDFGFETEKQSENNLVQIS